MYECAVIVLLSFSLKVMRGRRIKDFLKDMERLCLKEDTDMRSVIFVAQFVINLNILIEYL